MSNLSQHVKELGRTLQPGGKAIFQISDLERLKRFLVLGSDGGTYYASERKLTVENAECVKRLVQGPQGVQAVQVIANISDEGRAPKNDPALLALAIAVKFGTPEARARALEVLPDVARIGTHLFHFLDFAKSLGVGWGRSFRRAIGEWYTTKNELHLAQQLVKYQSRDGWSNRDALRLAHPKAKDEGQQALFRWAVKGDGEGKEWNGIQNPGVALVNAFERAKKTDSVKDIVELVTDFSLPREAIPTQFLNDIQVWEALLPSMKLEALIRNLGKMTSIGLIKPLSENEKVIAGRLEDQYALKKARIHPIKLLTALLTYQQGAGTKGSLSWTPSQRICQALENAFYLSFGFLEPTGKRTLKALDVSASMTWAACAGTPGITPRTGSALMAMVTARIEEQYAFMGFSHRLVRLDITPNMRLRDVVTYIDGTPMGATDCSLPMVWARENNIEVDCFEIYTDSETNSHRISPELALQQYRDKSGIDAKVVVVGMTASSSSIRNPDNQNMFEVVGFDTAAPELISDFIRG